MAPHTSRMPRVPSGVPLEEPWASLREIYIALRRSGTRILDPLDLSFSEFLTLQECASGPARASDIVDAIGITAAGATHLIDRLERRRLVRRRADRRDRRATLIELTPLGADLFRKANTAYLEALGRVRAAIPAGKWEALREGLEAVTAVLRKESDSRPLVAPEV